MVKKSRAKVRNTVEQRLGVIAAHWAYECDLAKTTGAVVFVTKEADVEGMPPVRVVTEGYNDRTTANLFAAGLIHAVAKLSSSERDEIMNMVRSRTSQLVPA